MMFGWWDIVLMLLVIFFGSSAISLMIIGAVAARDAIRRRYLRWTDKEWMHN